MNHQRQTNMRTLNLRPSRIAPRPSQLSVSDRRSRVRLRELCDEVLASYRMAAKGELFSEQDRADGQAIMGHVLGR